VTVDCGSAGEAPYPQNSANQRFPWAALPAADHVNDGPLETYPSSGPSHMWRRFA